MPAPAVPAPVRIAPGVRTRPVRMPGGIRERAALRRGSPESTEDFLRAGLAGEEVDMRMYRADRDAETPQFWTRATADRHDIDPVLTPHELMFVLDDAEDRDGVRTGPRHLARRAMLEVAKKSRKHMANGGKAAKPPEDTRLLVATAIQQGYSAAECNLAANDCAAIMGKVYSAVKRHEHDPERVWQKSDTHVMAMVDANTNTKVGTAAFFKQQGKEMPLRPHDILEVNDLGSEGFIFAHAQHPVDLHVERTAVASVQKRARDPDASANAAAASAAAAAANAMDVDAAAAPLRRVELTLTTDRRWPPLVDHASLPAELATDEFGKSCDVYLTGLRYTTTPPGPAADEPPTPPSALPPAVPPRAARARGPRFQVRCDVCGMQRKVPRGRVTDAIKAWPEDDPWVCYMANTWPPYIASYKCGKAEPADDDTDSDGSVYSVSGDEAADERAAQMLRDSAAEPLPEVDVTTVDTRHRTGPEVMAIIATLSDDELGTLTARVQPRVYDPVMPEPESAAAVREAIAKGVQKGAMPAIPDLAKRNSGIIYNDQGCHKVSFSLAVAPPPAWSMPPPSC